MTKTSMSPLSLCLLLLSLCSCSALQLARTTALTRRTTILAAFSAAACFDDGDNQVLADHVLHKVGYPVRAPSSNRLPAEFRRLHRC